MAATFAAFFAAQRLKAEPPVIDDFKRLRFFSPNGDGVRDVEPVSFRLEESDDVTVDVVDADGTRVRRLVSGVAAPAGQPVHASWDGITDGGGRAPDGTYRLRIILRRQGRAALSPRAFHLDTKPPRPAAIVSSSHVVSPGQPVDFRIRGVGRRARARIRIVRTDVAPVRTVRRFRLDRGVSRSRWDGLDAEGRPVASGTYLVAVTARDHAGNPGTGPPLPPRPGAVGGRPGITVRGLAVQTPARAIRAGELVSFRVDSRGRSYRWQVRRIGAQRAVKRSRRRKTSNVLAFRAPRGISGVYLLEVRSGRYETRVPFAVQSPESSRMLVVLPYLAWIGRDRLDDARDRDGVPNTLLNGGPVAYPRPFHGEEGLPPGFAEEVAPLLVFLDRVRVRYDLTTDLALALAPDSLPASRRGVLFAGTPQWVTRGLARRLRRYVAAGGRVGMFGPLALRSGVTIGDSRLTRPTPPAPADALGARIAPVREVPTVDGEPEPLSVLDELPEPGLLEAFSGQLDGFRSVEEMLAPGTGAKVVSSVGHPLSEQEIADAEAANRLPREVRPALSAVTTGEGAVYRIGLPGWVQRLEDGDAAVAQITRNLVDLLRDVRPRPRSAPR